MRWLQALMKMGRSNRSMFGRRNNNGMMWLSLVGAGIGGAMAYGMATSRRRGVESVVKPMQKQITNQIKNLVPNQ